VLPIFLALYILSFSLGIVVLALSILAYTRSGLASYRYFSILTAGTIIYLVGDTFDIYARVFSGLFGLGLPYIHLVLSATANGILGYMIPVLVFAVVDLEISRLRMWLHIAATVLLVALGAADDVFPDSMLAALNVVAITLLLLYGFWVLIRNFKRLESSQLKSLVRSAVAYVSVMLILVIAQLVVRSLPGSPSVLREYGVTQVAFYLGAMILLLVYAARFLFRGDPSVPTLLPDRFIEQYGISPRECEIISMIVRGYSNRKIGETLFISAMTVKNHIYHIYRKTGAGNKVQLLNIINSRE
jgi:DNA-binding CsgD family transcriptional regulator